VTPVREDDTDLSESATGNDNRVVQRDQAAFTIIRAGTDCGLVRFAFVSAKADEGGDANPPNEQSPVRVDYADPSFVKRVRDVVQDVRVGIEPFNLDLCQFEAFSLLRSEVRFKRCVCTTWRPLTKYCSTKVSMSPTVLFAGKALYAASVSFRLPTVG